MLSSSVLYSKHTTLVFSREQLPAHIHTYIGAHININHNQVMLNVMLNACEQVYSDVATKMQFIINASRVTRGHKLNSLVLNTQLITVSASAFSTGLQSRYLQVETGQETSAHVEQAAISDYAPSPSIARLFSTVQ
jgi:hypothetical protein